MVTAPDNQTVSMRPKSPDGASFGPFGTLPKRSFGLKLLLVCALALVMAIPALFVFSVVYDRSSRADRAIQDVASRYGGEQSAMGPVFILPYSEIVVTDDNKTVRKSGQVVLFPETGSVQADISTEVKKSGIHEIPVYLAELNFKASFRPERLQQALPQNAEPDWSNARLVISISDSRAVRETSTISINGTRLLIEPESSTRQKVNNRYRPIGVTTLAGRLQNAQTLSGDVPVTARMVVSGASKIGIAPFARTTDIQLTSDWDDPKFEGGFQQKVYTPNDKGGFTASWSIPYEARGIPGVGQDIALSQLTNPANGIEVRFVNAATPYQSVQRALKYAIMFIGFVFLAYFLFEVTSQQKAHPAQYVLVGLAQAVFYLLLLAMAEQFGFDLAFFTAAVMTVALTSSYAMTVFKSRQYGLRALGIFSGVYLLMYVLMRLEDYALLVGAFASFAAIGFTMYMTRNINWYGMQDDAPSDE